MIRLAAIQMCSRDDVDLNLESAARLIAAAVEDGAAMVSLPENFALMPRDTARLPERARERGGDIEAFLSAEARRHGVCLLGGSIPAPSDDGRVYGSCRVFDGAGLEVARYDKLHRFDVTVSASESYRESDYTAPGVAVATAPSPFGIVGLTICYDVRFPELYRVLGTRGARLFNVPSAFAASTGAVHWEVLLRARAIENLCFVVAPAQVGRHESGRLTHGHSMIVDPWGEVLNCLADGEGVCIADLDPRRLDAVRASFPAPRHRRIGDGDLVDAPRAGAP